MVDARVSRKNVLRDRINPGLNLMVLNRCCDCAKDAIEPKYFPYSKFVLYILARDEMGLSRIEMEII